MSLTVLAISKLTKFPVVLRLCCRSECLLTPSNLKLFVRGQTATLYWMVEGETSRITRFELTYELLDSPYGTFRITHGINRLTRSFQIVGLLPLQRYRLYMVTITDTGQSNSSEAIEFVGNLTGNGTDTFEYLARRSRGIQLEEGIVVFIVVGLWACAMVLFLKQWDNIRIIQPQETRYKHNPKNLHTIRIVKKTQDSVIYKNYSRKMSLTMVEREKKLMRMNTVPIMENVHTLHSFKEMPTIEMEENHSPDTGVIINETECTNV